MRGSRSRGAERPGTRKSSIAAIAFTPVVATKLEEAEEIKSWMALGSCDKSALLTFPQLLRIIDHAWKEGFDDIVRDKGLVQEARLVGHLRNAICHMTEIPVEEADRVRQAMRDWFRVVAP